MIFLLASSIIFLAIGIMIRHFKWYWLIAGYNTMSKEKKKNVDVEGLGRLLGNFSFLSAAIFLIATILLYFELTWAVTALIIIESIITIGVLIKAQKYDKNSWKNDDGTMQTSLKWGIGIGVLATIFAGVIVIMSMQQSTVIIEEDTFIIKGVYGIAIHYEEIIELELINSLPTIERRKNGSSAGSMRKGNFRLEEVGSAKLFVTVNNPPYVMLSTGSDIVYFNDIDPEITRDLYRQLQEKTGM